MGSLEVIVGPMFSGKSEELIKRLTRAKIAGKEIAAFKPDIDDRYNLYKIVSHSGSSFHATPVANPLEMVVANHAAVIGIDEAQFFGNELISVINAMVACDRQVIVAGLNLTYRLEPFGAVPELMNLADRLDKYNAVCHSCGKEAIFSQRLIDGNPASMDGPTIQVGALDTYEARCRGCFRRY